jgi:hypothetical protein
MKMIRCLPKDRPLCASCGKNLGCPSGTVCRDGSFYYYRECCGCRNFRIYGKRNANKKQWHKPGMNYKRFKKDHCEACGFVPVNPCQLDVDHKDGNHSNESLDNLQTLCANCHRLKTHMTGQAFSRKWRKS